VKRSGNTGKNPFRRTDVIAHEKERLVDRNDSMKLKEDTWELVGDTITNIVPQNPAGLGKRSKQAMERSPT
jgi:hypothetical protein